MCVCVCVCVCVAKPVAVELRCHATALICVADIVTFPRYIIKYDNESSMHIVVNMYIFL